MNKLFASNEYPANTYDLAIIGAGPAGSLAAALAAKAGLSVVMFEQKKHPRSKVCGGFLSNRAISLLPQDLDLLSLQSEPVYEIKVINKKASHTCNSNICLGRVLKRDELDQMLSKYAVDTGVKIVENDMIKSFHRVKADGVNNDLYLLATAKMKDVKLFAKYLVFADGVNGNSADKVGLSSKLSFCGWGLSKIINTKSPFAETGTLKFYPLPFLGGMGWSFYGPGWINHGIGGLTGKKTLIKVYNNLFSSEPGENQEQNKLKAWPLPFLGPLKKNAEYNSIVIGDAAGLVEPFSGEGLYNSFKSAHLAVSAILRSISTNESQVTAAEVYNPLFRKYFSFPFIKILTGAALLHARSTLAPSSLPSQIAALMNNSLWFNQVFDMSTIGTGRLIFKDVRD